MLRQQRMSVAVGSSDADSGADADSASKATAEIQQQQPSKKAQLDSPESGEELSDTEGFVSDICQYCNSPELSDLLLIVRRSEDDCTSVEEADQEEQEQPNQQQQQQREFHAHKFVLAKSSEFFRTILYSSNWPATSVSASATFGAERSLCELVEDEACYHCFEHFLRFLYAGRVFINRATSIGLLRLADKYQVWSLRQQTEKFMTENALPPNIRNAVLWYPWAKHLQLDRLAATCFNTICWNAKQAVELDEFLDADRDFVRDLLRTGRLVMEDEYAVLQQLLLRWLGVGNRFQRYVGELLPMIRFPMMSAKQLSELETSSLSQTEESSELLAGLIAKAYRFRALCPWQHELKQAAFTGNFYRPRSYLGLAVDSIKVGNTMRFGLQVEIRTQSGPVPSSIRDAEWKMVYQKSSDSWTFKLMSQDSSFPAGAGVNVDLVALCENETGDIINYFRAKDFLFSRSSQFCQCQFDISKGPGRRDAKTLHILLRITSLNVQSAAT